MRLRKLLYPLSWLYGGITSIRNKCFDEGILKSQSYSLPIISIGNITVGGTGKTPLTEYIIRLLKGDHQLTLLSRGYKRKTKGALLAKPNSMAADIGDEPYQIMKKFQSVNVCVAEKRVEGMELILKNTNTDVVLMDDAYQHRYVKPGFSLLVIDYNRPLWNDCPFPAGDLRETRLGQNRADVIVVNKCPHTFSEVERVEWLAKLKPSASQEVYFTTIDYGRPTALEPKDQSFDISGPIIGLAGIAKPEGFYGQLKQHYNLIDTISFPDHHHFTKSDEQSIENLLRQNAEAFIVTTEKDAVRFGHLPEAVKKRSWYIPIELRVLFNEEKQFENRIRNYVTNHSANC
ncbi:MAG: tetraacyldisaccharide 4'-kinase [Carboxylicivirga sp.]|jgi:tetraacyldisaccharide 4'-kinase|nr:tetraacyldisaccharide 4'-kinase [Carboxylicivirga sp.]